MKQTSADNLIPAKSAPSRVRSVLGSRAFALAVIFVFIALSIAGIVLPQAPQDVVANPAAFNQWLGEFAYPRFGNLTTPLAAAGLFDVFHSPWLITIGSLVAVSTVVCTVNRLRKRRESRSASPPHENEAFYLEGDYHTVINNTDKTVPEAARAAELALKQNGYRVSGEATRDSHYLAADKNHRFGLGTYLTHFAVILFLAGFVAGHYSGFHLDSFIVPEGTMRELGQNTGLSLYLEDFSDEYWPDGTPKDFSSRVLLLKNGSPVKEGVIQVNHPLSYQGVSFYQSSFGPAAGIEVRNASGELVYADSVALIRLMGSDIIRRPLGGFELPTEGLMVYIVGPSLAQPDPVIPAGQVGLEFYSLESLEPLGWAQPAQGLAVNFSNLEFTFTGMGQYSDFQVARDPGKNLIWVASGFLMAGLIMVFYFPYRQLWVLTRPGGGGGSQWLLRLSANPRFGARSEFERLVKKLTESP